MFRLCADIGRIENGTRELSLLLIRVLASTQFNDAELVSIMATYCFLDEFILLFI